MGGPEVILLRKVSQSFPAKTKAFAAFCGASGLEQIIASATLCRYYAANAPVYQVDILDTNTMTFHGGKLIPVTLTPFAHIVLPLVKAVWGNSCRFTFAQRHSLQYWMTCSCVITGALATVPRMYHGVATLIASGAIWTGGTNPQVWNFARGQTSSWGQADIRVASCIILLHENIQNIQAAEA